MFKVHALEFFKLGECSSATRSGCGVDRPSARYARDCGDGGGYVAEGGKAGEVQEAGGVTTGRKIIIGIGLGLAILATDIPSSIMFKLGLAAGAVPPSEYGVLFGLLLAACAYFWPDQNSN